MLIIHTITLDMMHPDIPPRIHVKQGDNLSRALRVLLNCDGEPWLITGNVTPLVRWFACDPDSGESTRGIYDTLPDGTHAWNITDNQLDLILAPQMFALPGLVQADVVLISEGEVLSTFTFEFYVNQSISDGTDPQIQNYYQISTLGQVNEAIAGLQEFQTDAQTRLANLEQQMDELYRMVLDLQGT